MRRDLRGDCKRWIQRAGELGIKEAEIARYARTTPKRVQYVRAEEAAKNVEVIYIGSHDNG